MPDRGWCCRLSKKTDRTENVSAGQTLAQLERLARLMRSASHAHNVNAAQWEALRYISRANSFSNSPSALTRYLGATKGTISQTLLSLIEKGTIAKSSRGDDARSVVLVLTEAGQKILDADPLSNLDKAIANLGDKTAKRFSKGLSEILASEIARQNEPSFGNCKTCAHANKERDSVHCKIMGLNVPPVDVEKFCVYHFEKK